MAVVVLIGLENAHYKGQIRNATPPLGLACLAAFAREKRPGKDSFVIIDEAVKPLSSKQWQEKLAGITPDIIGISAMTPDANALTRKIELFKNLLPKTPIVAGGPHATALGARLLENPGIDYAVAGEGELGFAGLLDALEKGEKYPENYIPGLIFKKPDGSIKENPVNNDLLDVNTLPLPAWDLISFEDYSTLARMTPSKVGGFYAPIMTSRGCPFSCIYCHDVFGSRFRAMTPMRVIEHMEQLIYQYNIKDFEIIDDIFNLDYDRALEICRLIQERGLNICFSFPNGLRTDLLDRRLIRALAQAGAYHIAFAVETGSKHLQKAIKKHLNLEKVRQNIAYAAEEGIFTWGFFMLGFPNESKEQVKKTLDFAFSSKLHGAFFFTVIPFPGTALARQCLSEEKALAAASDSSYFITQNSLSQLSPKELSRMQTMAFLRFFLNPARIVRIGRDYPGGWACLLSRAAYFFELLFWVRRRRQVLS
ncbi:MAG: radical SAM protein [Desulfatibacillaceae bacterium]|nr:radical SAM protein [Desulfatibacillaceae bacterium]